MTSKITPFSPADARKNKSLILPPELIQAINELLTERYGRKNIEIDASEIIERARNIRGDNVLNNFGADWYDKGFMDFESVYENQGWSVKYTKPSYDESFKAYYTFMELT